MPVITNQTLQQDVRVPYAKLHQLQPYTYVFLHECFGRHGAGSEAGA